MNSEFREGYVLFVCTGNTCRSPMAEKLFLHAIKSEKEPIKSIQAKSAGLGAFEGSPPSTYTIKVLNDCNIRIEGHKSHQLTQKMVDGALVIFCMTKVHREILENEYDLEEKKVLLMRELLPGIEGVDIRDPFGESLEEYQACRDNMVEAIPWIINFLKKEIFALK